MLEHTLEDVHLLINVKLQEPFTHSRRLSYFRLLTTFLIITSLLFGCKKSSKIVLPNGASYKGMVSNGKPHGKGKIVFQDMKYEGDFWEGKRHGNGIQYWTRGLHEGESYLGEWKNDERNGYGIQIWPDGRKYTGVWKSNRQNGKGVLTNATGDTYNGYFKDDQPDGEGTHTKSDGSIIYKGLWSKGKPIK